jgi:branched-chain amino acid transport system ATP-binding protein
VSTRPSNTEVSRQLGSLLFEARNLRIAFGGIVALNGVDLKAQEGETLGVIGPNGAGKTTLFNCVCGFYRSTGEIQFANVEMGQLSPYRRARLGIARTFQTPVLLESADVMENVMLGGFHRGRAGFLLTAIRIGPATAEERQVRDAAAAVLEEVGIANWARRLARELPHGIRKRVELARALLPNPRLLLLDEPCSGLNHDETAEIGRLLDEIRRSRGTTIFLVEHNMSLVMSLADNIIVLDQGLTIARGTPEEVRRDPAVIAAYFGEVQNAAS